MENVNIKFRYSNLDKQCKKKRNSNLANEITKLYIYFTDMRFKIPFEVTFRLYYHLHVQRFSCQKDIFYVEVIITDIFNPVAREEIISCPSFSYALYRCDWFHDGGKSFTE